MKRISLLDVEFDVLVLDNDKMLLQVINLGDSPAVSVPLIGQSILDLYYPEIQNLVASESELLIYCEAVNQEKILSSIIESVGKITVSKQKTLSIDVCFELSLDWEQVCKHTGKMKEAIIKKLLSGSFPLINYGFQPGFMYLNGLTKALHVPRRDRPRLRVNKGSLAIGGKYIGIYCSDAPGGWNIIGRTEHYIKDNLEIKNLPVIGQEITFNRLDKDTYLRKHKNG